jgi:haloacetate dehalogenase
MPLFDGFTLETIQLPAGPVRLRRGGEGPPLVCLHGNPQTHLMWHALAPALARHFTVYCPDLRGYGLSPKPPASADHAAYAKRAMAQDVIALMDHFGHARFTMVSHDRGSRTAHRLALDHPDRLARLAVMDIVPTLEHFERTDMDFALAYAHWFYLAMPAPFPEEMIGHDPEGWFGHHCGRTSASTGLFHPEALQDYLAFIRDPEVIRGICEDYRAAITIDLVHDRASRAAGAKIACPLLALWCERGIIGKMYDPLALWRAYSDAPVTGAAMPAGHYLAEEAPEAVLAHLIPFLTE